MFGMLRPNSPIEDQSPLCPSASPPPAGSLAPMPASEYPSRETLLGGAKAWSALQGFAVVIARSRENRLWLKCDRGGVYENRRNLTPAARKRKRGDSRLLGCPFKMLATRKKDGTWRVQTTIAEHNHEASGDLSAHPTLRRMSEEQLQRVQEMFDEGKTPAETLDVLKTIWPAINVLTRDIYNARKKYKTQKEEAEAAAGLGGESEMQYEDPNGIFPGPDDNGRWAWVPDGEEVTNKKSKRTRRRTVMAPATQATDELPDSTLDPQLQTPQLPHTSQVSNLTPEQQLFNAIQNHPYTAQPQRTQSQSSLQSSAPTRLPHAPQINGTPNYIPPSLPSPSPTASPSRLRSQVQTRREVGPAATAIMTSSAPSEEDPGNLSSVPKAPTQKVLMTRIERMEQEQRDQKNMLAQILGAVQGINGS